MNIIIEAERNLLRKRQEVIIVSEGVTVKIIDFDFSG
jgi:hypothetical protein